MRAMVFDRYGEPDVMRLRDVAVPEPQEDEVLIRVGYAGVNPADSKARVGHSARGLRYQDVDFPFITSMDAASVVERPIPKSKGTCERKRPSAHRCRYEARPDVR